MELPSISVTISGNAVAWYGAILATVGTLVQLLNFLRDRKVVKISYQTNLKMAGGQSVIYGPDLYVLVKVVNTGRRPVTISTVGALYRDGTGAIFPDTRPLMPTEIKEGQAIQVIIKQEGIGFEKMAFIEATDAAGTNFRLGVAPVWRRALWAIWRPRSPQISPEVA